MKISKRDLTAASRPVKVDKNLVKEMTGFFFENYFKNSNDFKKDFTTTNVKGEELSFVLSIKYEHSKSNSLVLDAYTLSPKDKSSGHMIIVICNKNVNKGIVKLNMLTYDRLINLTLEHELTHVSDIIEKEICHDSSNSYYNSPQEFKAHSQTIVTDIADNIGDYDVKNVNHDFVLSALKLSATYNYIEQYLNSKNKKSIYKMIYKLISSGEINAYKKR